VLQFISLRFLAHLYLGKHTIKFSHNVWHSLVVFVIVQTLLKHKSAALVDLVDLFKCLDFPRLKLLLVNRYFHLL